MRSRSKIIAVALLLAVAAYFLLNTPADKAPAEIAGRPKHKSLMLLPLNFQTPDPTAALKPLPGPKPIDENSPDQTDPDAQAIHDIAANISRLLSEYDFDGVANYTQPGTEEETKDTLERLLRGPDGPKRVQMLAHAFDSFQYQTPLVPNTKNLLYFQDKTIYSTAASSPLLQPLTPAEREAVTTISVAFVKKDGQWYLFDQALGYLDNASHNTPLPTVVGVNPLPDR
jgi:hypothetical protein